MNADFYFEVNLPFCRESIFVKEYTNQWHINTIKYINNGNYKHIANHFESIIQEHVQDKEILPKLTVVDKLVILLSLYNQCIDNRVTFTANVNNRPGTKLHINITSIIKNIFNHNYRIFEEEKIAPDTYINYTIPSSLYNEPEDIFTDIIYTIFSAPHKYYFHAFNRDEQKLFLDSITIPLLKSSKKAIENLRQNIPTIPAIIGPSNSDFKTIYIDIFANDALYLISSLYNDEIYNLYYKQYHLIKNINTTYDHFLQMTPSEGNAFLKLYENEIKESNLNSEQ